MESARLMLPNDLDNQISSITHITLENTQQQIKIYQLSLQWKFTSKNQLNVLCHQ